MSARARLFSGISTGWVSLGTLAVVQIWQVKLARENLPSDEFAVFGLISSLIASLMIAEFGIRNAFARLLIDAIGDVESVYRRFWCSTVVVFAFQTILILAAALVCVPFLSVWFSIPPATAEIGRKIFIVQAVLTGLQYGLSHHSVALMATQRFAFLNNSATLASLVGALLFWWGIRSGFGLWSYVILSAPGICLTCFIYPAATRKAQLTRKFSFSYVSGGEMRKIFSLGFDLFLVALYNLALGNATLLFAGIFLPLAMVSVLAVNLKFVQLLIQALQRIPGTADPILSRMIAVNDITKFREKWFLISKISIGLTALSSGVSYLWAGTVVALWTSKQDTLTGLELLLVALMPLRYMAQMVYVISPTMFKAVHRIRTAMLTELIVYIGLGFLLGRAYGLKGILIANIASLFVGSLIPGLVLMAKLSGCKSKLMIHAALKMLIPGVCAAGALAYMLPNPEVRSISELIAWTFCWTLGVTGFYWLQGLDTKERQAILQILFRKATPAST